MNFLIYQKADIGSNFSYPFVMYGRKALRGIIFILCIGLAGFLGCSNKAKQKSVNDSPNATAVQPIAKQVIKGVVQLGRVSKATVKAFKISPAGGFQDLGETTTNTSGEFSLSIDSVESSPILIRSFGGTFLDESTNKKIVLGDKESLSSIAIVSSGEREIAASITPISHLIAERALENSKKEKRGLEEAKKDAEIEIAKNVLGVDENDLRVLPADPTNPGDVSSANARLAFYIAAISQKHKNDGTSSEQGISPIQSITILAENIKANGFTSSNQSFQAEFQKAAKEIAQSNNPSANFIGFTELANNLDFNKRAGEPGIPPVVPPANGPPPLVPGPVLPPINPPVIPPAACVPPPPQLPPLPAIGGPLLPTGFVSCSDVGLPPDPTIPGDLGCPAPCGGSQSNPATACSAWEALSNCQKAKCDSQCGVLPCVPSFTGGALSCALGGCAVSTGSFPIGQWVCPTAPPPFPAPFPDCSTLTAGVCNAACGPGLTCQSFNTQCVKVDGTIGLGQSGMCLPIPTP